MFTTIYKIILVLFFVWAWTNNSKASNGNILSTKHDRSLAQHDILPNKQDDHSYVTKCDDNDLFSTQFKQYMISDYNPDAYVQIRRYYKNVSIYITDIKHELIKTLANRNDPQITNILAKNIQHNDLIRMYDFFKHVMSSDEYLQILHQSCESLKYKSLNYRDDAAKFHNSVLYLLNTYFYLTNSKKSFKQRFTQLEVNHKQPIHKKKGFKFKAKYLNIFKLGEKIDKHFRTKLLEEIIKEEIDPFGKVSFKKYFKLSTYALFNPLFLSVCLFVADPITHTVLANALLALILLTYVHSIYKVNKDLKSIKRIIQGSRITKKEKFYLIIYRKNIL
ncbi:exported protein, unknown function [Hepatocystis sp. ex Piliocolobus tephrosceles]|nr:exported protein, unknown function [Hepatocystis sp. ex Piliocolobus tephrosceles]